MKRVIGACRLDEITAQLIDSVLGHGHTCGLMPKAATTPLYIIRHSSIHSRGIFARNDVSKGTEILEYLGEKISKAESERRANERLDRAEKTGEAAVYIFNLNKKQDLDGSGKDNHARLINHSCDPNCEALQSRGRIWICAVRDIKKDEELSFNYGFDLENWDRHECCCGSERCVGFIVGEEYWPGLKKKIEARIAKFEKIKKAAAQVINKAAPAPGKAVKKVAAKKVAVKKVAVKKVAAKKVAAKKITAKKATK